MKSQSRPIVSGELLVADPGKTSRRELRELINHEAGDLRPGHTSTRAYGAPRLNREKVLFRAVILCVLRLPTLWNCLIRSALEFGCFPDVACWGLQWIIRINI